MPKKLKIKKRVDIVSVEFETAKAIAKTFMQAHKKTLELLEKA